VVTLTGADFWTAPLDGVLNRFTANVTSNSVAFNFFWPPDIARWGIVERIGSTALEINGHGAGSINESTIEGQLTAAVEYGFDLRDYDRVGCQTHGMTFRFTRSDSAPPPRPLDISESCVPVLLSPSDGALLDNGRLDRLDEIVWDFEWTGCPGAEYHLFVQGATAIFPVVDRSGIARPSFRSISCGHIAGANLARWSWTVRATTNGQWGRWSEPRWFSVEPVDTDRADRDCRTTPLGKISSWWPTPPSTAHAVAGARRSNSG
jgi:hypothetical protein